MRLRLLSCALHASSFSRSRKRCSFKARALFMASANKQSGDAMGANIGITDIGIWLLCNS